jgi:predicted protein tyrosine phosphatase
VPETDVSKWDSMTRILFVCWANMDRSPTAERLLRDRKGFEVSSAGIWRYARRPLSRQLLDWADLVLVMEEKHRDAVLKLSPRAADKVVILGIPDIYARDDPALVQLLKSKISEQLIVEW